MLLLSILFSTIFYSVLGDGEFLIIHSPPSVKFQGDESIDQSLIPEVLSASIGFTTKSGSDWSGLTVLDPFNYAEGVVVVVCEGISSLGKSKNFKKFPLNTNEDEELTWKAIKEAVVDRNPIENNTLVRIELGSSPVSLDDVESKYLDKQVEEDAGFLQQLVELTNFANRKETMDGVPDVYWLVLNGLHPLSDLRGIHNPAVIEAKEKVHEALTKIGETFSDYYQDRVLVTVIATDSLHTRRTRSIDEKASNNELTYAVEYHRDFPAIFNIILWFTVASILSLIAISYFIANMDPGRDSIIYRMTSNRMKKDS